MSRFQLKSPKTMAAVVGAFGFKNKGIIGLSDDGISLCVFDSSSIHAKVEFPKEMFDLITCPERIDLCIDILAFRECLGLIRNSLECSEILYSPESPELKIRISEDNIETNCVLATFEMETTMLFDYFVTHETTNKMIIKSEWLRNVLFEIESDVSDIVIEFNVSQELLVTWESMYGKGSVSIDRNSDICESSNIIQQMSCEYKHALFQNCLKSMALSKKTSIEVSHDGILFMQFMIESDHSQVFIEFLLVQNASYS